MSPKRWQRPCRDPFSIVILYTVITFRELARLKQMIRKVDPDTFLVVTDTLEVMGRRIGNRPHW